MAPRSGRDREASRASTNGQLFFFYFFFRIIFFLQPGWKGVPDAAGLGGSDGCKKKNFEKKNKSGKLGMRTVR